MPWQALKTGTADCICVTVPNSRYDKKFNDVMMSRYLRMYDAFTEKDDGVAVEIGNDF